MKILFTAFKGVHNTSFQLMDQTAANYILLTNSFQGLEKDISFISSDYCIVYMFGVDKKLIDKVRKEETYQLPRSITAHTCTNHIYPRFIHAIPSNNVLNEGL